MKLFVTGVNGQLGYDVVCEAIKRGYNVIASDISVDYNGIMKLPSKNLKYLPLDITNSEHVRKTLLHEKPKVVIHCAAWTAVDAAEEIVNYLKVYQVNVEGTKNIADACKLLDCKMIYISTDYVFDGQGQEAWEPDCKNFKPLNEYGKSKLMGEQIVSQSLEKFYIVRTSWVFGLNGNNFIKTMLKVGKKNETVRVVNDQIGSPTYTFELARLLIDMSETEKFGFYHATNSGEYISWYDFCCEIYKIANYTTKVIPVSTEEYGISKAKRPFNSRMDKNKLIKNGFKELPYWKESLMDYFEKLNLEK